MKKTFFITLTLFLAFAFFLYAQGKTNFTGVWQLDKTKGKLPQMGGGGGEYPDTKLNITQKDKDIKIETTRVFQDNERTTTISLVIGAGETKVEAGFGGGGGRGGAGGGQPPVSIGKAELSKDGSLVITVKTTRTTKDGGTSSSETVSTYSISKDSKILTENRKSTSQRGESEAVLVYNKVVVKVVK